MILIKRPYSMTTKLIDLIPQKDKRDLYRLYKELFKINKSNPELLPPMRLNSIFTNIMASQDWGWHVIGISQDALKAYKKNNFKHPKGKLHRGHLTMRAKTTNQFFGLDKPLSLDNFFELYLKNDKTIIMTKEENASNKVPKGYKKISNPKAELFVNAPIGWKHRELETSFLKSLK